MTSVGATRSSWTSIWRTCRTHGRCRPVLRRLALHLPIREYSATGAGSRLSRQEGLPRGSPGQPFHCRTAFRRLSRTNERSADPDPAGGDDPGQASRRPRRMTMRHWITSFLLVDDFSHIGEPRRLGKRQLRKRRLTAVWRYLQGRHRGHPAPFRQLRVGPGRRGAAQRSRPAGAPTPRSPPDRTAGP